MTVAMFQALVASMSAPGVPPEAWDYRLGNRSALEWVIYQYQLKTDKRSPGDAALASMKALMKTIDDATLANLVGALAA